MSFLKEFKEDLSLAISELLPQELNEEEEVSETEGNLAEKKGVQPLKEKSQESKAEPQKSKGKSHQKNNEKTDANAVKKDTEKRDAIKKDAPKKDTSKKDTEKKDEPKPEEELAEVIHLETLFPKEEISNEPLSKEEPPMKEPVPIPNEAKPENEAIGGAFEEPAKEKEQKTMESDNNIENVEAEKTMDEMMTGTVETEEMNLSSMDVIMPGSIPEEDIVPEPVSPRRSSETATITAGTRIHGDIESDGSLEILGTINGNVTCNGKLTVTGTVVGNSNADEVYADSAKIEGEINSAGAVKIGLGSVILGNVNATSAVIAGAIRGDIDVHGPVIVDTSAVVMGNIKSRSVQINNGAVIEGFCSQCYSDVSVKNFFEENKLSTEKKSEKKSEKK